MILRLLTVDRVSDDSVFYAFGAKRAVFSKETQPFLHIHLKLPVTYSIIHETINSYRYAQKQ